MKRAALVLALCVACASDPSRPEPSLIPSEFPATGFSQVRACRAPGEHSALGGFTVWVNDQAASAFEALWRDTAQVTSMPSGALVIKEVHSDSDCSPGSVFLRVAMAKEPGFDPAHGDWHWQEIEKSGRVMADGSVSSCIDCHRGTASCSGFGADNGKDYLCTEP